jgi:hypothetical protein
MRETALSHLNIVVDMFFSCDSADKIARFAIVSEQKAWFVYLMFPESGIRMKGTMEFGE